MAYCDPRLRKLRDERIVELYNDGYSEAQVGKLVGLTRSRVGAILDDYEVTKRPRGRQKKCLERTI